MIFISRVTYLYQIATAPLEAHQIAQKINEGENSYMVNWLKTKCKTALSCTMVQIFRHLQKI